MTETCEGRGCRYMGYSYQASAESQDGSIWKGSVVVGEEYEGHMGSKRFLVEDAFQDSSDALRAAEALGKRIIDRVVPGIEQLWPRGRPLDH